MESVRNVLKVWELNKIVKERAYQESLRGKYEELKSGDVESVETEWKMFRGTVSECTNDVCGVIRVGGQRNESEWWSKEVAVVGAEKRRAFEEWLQRRDRVTYDRYREQKAVVKQRVEVGKRMADWSQGDRLENDFEIKKNMFWRDVKRVRKGEQARAEMLKDVNGQILRYGVEVRRR